MWGAVNWVSVSRDYDVSQAGVLVVGHPSGGRYCVPPAVQRGLCVGVFQIAAAGSQSAIWGFGLYESTAQPAASQRLSKVFQRSAVPVGSSYAYLEAPRTPEAAQRTLKIPTEAITRAGKL